MHSLPSLESLHDHHPPETQHLSHNTPNTINNNNNPSPMSAKPAFMEIQLLEQQGHLGGGSSTAVTCDPSSMYNHHHSTTSIRSPYTSGTLPGGIALPEYATRSPLAGYPFTGIPPLSTGYAPPPPPSAPIPPTFGMSHYQSPPLGLGRDGEIHL